MGLEMNTDPSRQTRAQAKELMSKRDAIEAEIAGVVEKLRANGGVGEKGPLLDKEGYPRADIDVAAARKDRHRLAELHFDHKELTKSIEALLLQIHSSSASAPTAKPAQTAAPHTPYPVAPTPTTTAAPAGTSTASASTATAMDVDVGDRLGTGASSSTMTSSSTPTMTSSFAPATTSSSSASGAASSGPASHSEGHAFAIIDEVAPGSPAFEDGIRLGDMVLRFGGVVLPAGTTTGHGNAGTGSGAGAGPGGGAAGGVHDAASLLRAVAEEVGWCTPGSADAITVVVFRPTEGIRELRVRPREWAGRGRLGWVLFKPKCSCYCVILVFAVLMIKSM
eukprot:jgi/Mesvir1/6468/Mv19543-RA.1